jgi:hypothetical protein
VTGFEHDAVAVPLWNSSSMGGIICRTLARMPLVAADISGPFSAATMTGASPLTLLEVLTVLAKVGVL